MAEFKKVAMGVTQRQIDDMEFIERAYGLESRASAVGTALAITRAIAERVDDRSRLVLHKADGTRQEIQLPGRL